MTIELTRPATAGSDTTGSTTAPELLARHRPGHSLEAPFYSDPQIFDLDLRGIFEAHWLFVAAEAEIPEPGDYVTVELGRYSVIVMRDDDEDVRAFHNVCRHRGSRLLDDPCGSVGNLVCPYHHWTYGTDGRLLHADNQPPTLDRSGLSLRPVHVRAVAGLVFICLAPEPPTDFDAVMDRVRPYLAPYELTHTKVAHQVDIVEEGNWKLVMENNRECYHCDGHPELLTAYFPLHGYTEEDCPPRLRPAWARYAQARAELAASCRRQGFPREKMRELEDRPTGFMLDHAPLDGAGASYSAGGEVVVRRRLGAIDDDRFGDLHLHLQPNSWFHFLSDHAVVFSVLPIDATHSRLRTTWLVHEDAVEGVDYDLPSLTHVWNATNSQDSVFVARTQRGVMDPAYVPGPYSEVEGDVEAFVGWYVKRLSAWLSR